MTNELDQALKYFAVQIERLQQGLALDSPPMRKAAVEAGLSTLRADFERIVNDLLTEANA